MDIAKAIAQAKQRAGLDYTRKRDTEEFKRDVKNWRAAEKPDRILHRMAGLGMQNEMIEIAAAAIVGESDAGFNPLERIIETSQLMSAIFLHLGAQRMRAVGRIISESGRGFGTGFLISPRLLMTNNHVLESASAAARCRVQFDFVKMIDGTIGATEIYQLVPNEFFLTSAAETDPNLDYTIVAVEAVNGDGKELSRRGCIPLIAASGKLTLGDLANIIQHPGGEAQQVALRDSKVVTPLDHFIRYEADTQPGSSGSPVFNDLWQLAALHHSGVPEEVRPGVYRLIDGGEWDTSQPMSHEEQLRMAARVKWIANEGVRISSIVSDVQQRLRDDPARLAMFEDAVREHITPAPPVEDEKAAPGPVAVSRSTAGNAVTWTVPLRVTVQLGPDIQLSIANDATTAHAAEPAPAVVSPEPARRGDIESAAARVRESLAGRGGVLEVRTGFLWQNGEMTDTEAVVVVLHPRSAVVESLEELGIPAEVDGFPVDLTVGGATAVFHAMERGVGPTAEALSIADLLQESVPSIGYKPPANVKLDAVNDQMEVICHASPDDGWPVLDEFLGRTKETITLGMFDLTAPKIVAKFKELAAKPKFRMNLAIQRGMVGGLGGEKQNDVPEDQFIADMRKLMGKRFRQAFVDVAQDDRTFASAYHIKVAVRDHEEIWLSSGNMQTSNQPPIRPAAEGETTFSPLRRFNREWHVVIRQKDLARTFEAFLLHDLKTAEENPAEPPKPKDEALLPLLLVEPEFLEAGKKPRYFPRERFEGKFKVQPLLTPDNFLENVIPVIESAKERLFIQNQALNLLRPQKNNEADFLKLFAAIRDRQKAGVDVRLIFRVLPVDEDGARAMKENLVKFGLKKKSILAQEHCHTKGVIVDSKVVIIGSHNWSNQGAIANRDASLIIHDADIATYFEKIFLFDWETLTREPRPPKPVKKKKPAEEALMPPAIPLVRVTADELVLGD